MIIEILDAVFNLSPPFIGGKFTIGFYVLCISSTAVAVGVAVLLSHCFPWFTNSAPGMLACVSTSVIAGWAVYAIGKAKLPQ